MDCLSSDEEGRAEGSSVKQSENYFVIGKELKDFIVYPKDSNLNLAWQGSESRNFEK